VLRRALLVWGTGHLALGDRRGWLLLLIQPLAICGLVVLAALMIEGTRWLAVLIALVGFVLLWLGQALHAHYLAQRGGATGGGEIQVVALLPVLVVLLGGFWLVGGALGSPGATLQQYVSAWQNGNPAGAAQLFHVPADSAALTATWQAQRQYLAALVDDAARQYGSQAGLDPALPFNSLRFEELPGQRGGGRAVVAIDLVRRERFETELFGFIPTAAQRTVLVRRLGLVRLHAEAARTPWWLPAGMANPSRVWQIDEVQLTVDG
jgi:hypothetical protein